ncbi:S26 family signal peptidase [Alicyclobacillus hesperidum]|uniref:Signal peptidase I n=1 Tax=Alicyclobacillus hesperidum TaxID=89784 RepID=A0AA37U653_9BACL|nr:signal peptidase I [Alicyclobacillus hesperidum]GLV13114.1 S26 family signal peptidase [Alicyclobacillus hesperidum]
MKRIVKFGSNLITVVLGIFLVLTMYAAVSTRLSNNGAPRMFGLEWYEVLSGSMEPGIHVGSIIFDKPHVDVNQLKVGDVITFKAPENEFPDYSADHGQLIITHRIHAIVHKDGQLEFQTKGDANNAPDPNLVPASNVIAQYDNITIPYLGYYLNFVKTKLGIGLLIILPGALLIISTLVSLFKEILRLQGPKKSDANPESSSEGMQV